MTIRPPEEHLDVRVVVHTHWDREWYRPFVQFRARLVDLIDAVLDGAGGAPFLLDGQAVVLEDYLEVRPERAADLSHALRRGDIEAGPWLVLADTLMPSGEGLVRNLLAGRHVLRGLRADSPPVLYCPDSFGHPAALPTVAAGFGLPLVILWRGYGGRSHPAGDTAVWTAPDESSVRLYHLAPNGYELGSHLPTDADGAARRWQAMRTGMAPRATTGLVLLPAGADHHAPQDGVDAAITTLAAAARPDRVTRSSLATFAADAVARDAALPVVRGELRDSYGYAWVLQGTFAARAYQKRRYARTEFLLLRDMEPWLALARRRGQGVDRRHHARSAWRPLLLCQPHDTLCGCSTDDVARAMDARLDDAHAAATDLRDLAILDLLGHDANDARQHPEDWQPVVVIRNAVPRIRTGVADIEVDVIVDEVPVGPGSAGHAATRRRPGPVSLGAPPVATQFISGKRRFAREEASRHYPRTRLVERRRILAWVTDVPAYGLRTAGIRSGAVRAVAPSAVGGADGAIEGNGQRVEVVNGALRFSAPGLVIDDWLSFECEGERGDLYTRSAIPGTRARVRLLRARVTMRGPLRAELSTDWRVSLPPRRLTTATGEERRAGAVRQRVRAAISLDAGSPCVRIAISGDNRMSDARLRAVLRTGIPRPVVVADAAFGPVVREPVDSSGAPGETAPPTAPLHRYVSLFDDGRGATILSDGLAEYEATPGGSVCVTLLRLVDELSRSDLPERPGHAGYPAAVPAAQCAGAFSATLGFAVHAARSDATTALVDRLSDDLLLPLSGETWRTAIAPPATVPGVELHGDGLAMPAIKESEDGQWLVLRCVNLLDRAVEGAWAAAFITEAVAARLDETPLTAPEPARGRVAFTAGPRAVVTLLVR